MTTVDVAEVSAGRSDRELTFAVEQFLYAEADLLDRWRLHEWLDLFTVDSHYLVPTTDRPHGDPARDLFLIQDDRFLLEQRVNSLLTRAAHAEFPQSKTRRMIGNVVAEDLGDEISVKANFAIFRSRRGVVDTYVGHYRHRVIREEEDGFRFVSRKSVLDLDALRPHGKVSIIL